MDLTLTKPCSFLKLFQYEDLKMEFGDGETFLVDDTRAVRVDVLLVLDERIVAGDINSQLRLQGDQVGAAPAGDADLRQGRLRVFQEGFLEGRIEPGPGHHPGADMGPDLRTSYSPLVPTQVREDFSNWEWDVTVSC